MDATKSCQSFPQDAPKPLGRDFHSMDCTDMVIGTVRQGSFSRVEDYYTRDRWEELILKLLILVTKVTSSSSRSTPQPDAFYGGSSSLTGALGFERNGQTTIIFRRPVRGRGQSDHDFDGELFFIWAHGRKDLSFYGTDELKYHGPSNKGSITISKSSPRRV